MGIEEARVSAGVEGLSGWDPAAFTKIDVSSLYSAYSRPELVEKIDTVLRRITIDTASVTKMELRYSYVPRSDKDMARDVLSRIHRIEQDRYNLLVGYQETPYSREVLEFMLKQLDQMKSEYLKLFTGTTIKESVCFTLLFLPEKAGEEFVLAGFSPASGLTQGSGSEIKIALKAAGNTAKIGNDPTPMGASTGYCYRIPESVEVIVSFQGKSMALARLLISQLGVVRTLPPDAGKVELDPETGSLIRVFVD
jgi:hypothetical protein